MKYLLVTILAALVSVSFAHGAEQGKHLFILSGQSNMTNLDPRLSFIPTLEKAFGKNNIIVVKDSLGSQPIRRWYKKWAPLQPIKGNKPRATGDLYDHLMVKVNAAIKGQKIQTVTFIWMQGEWDAKEPYGDVYAASLKGLIGQLSEDMARTDINFIIGRINDANNDARGIMIRNAQVEAAESLPHSAWIDTDDLNGPDNGTGVHATEEGYKILGARFAEKAIQLIREQHS